MARDDASLPALDANSAEALRASALRAYRFAWHFPNEAANLLAFAAELEARADALSRVDDQAPQPSQATDCEEAKKTA